VRRYWKRELDADCKEISVRKKKKREKKPHSVWGKILLLRRKLDRSLALIRAQMARLNARINALQEQVNGLQGGSSSVIAFLRGKLNTRVTIETTAGSIFGTLIAIGEDHVQIAEPNGSIVIVPFRSFLSVA
jgi:cell division protein FtsB